MSAPFNSLRGRAALLTVHVLLGLAADARAQPNVSQKVEGERLMAKIIALSRVRVLSTEAVTRTLGVRLGPVKQMTPYRSSRPIVPDALIAGGHILYELVAAHELDLVGGFATGLAIEREVRGRLYLYWQLRDLAGRLRQIYLGPAADPTARELRDALAAYKVRRAPIVADLERLTAAYVASGGPRHVGHHFRVVDALARAGLFRAGVLLVGSHAFVSIGAALGVSWSAEDAATADIDLCRDEFVTVACVEQVALDVPGILHSLDPSFFLVPELHLKRPSTSISSRRAGIKLDLLTTARTPRDDRPRMIGPLGLAAQPLRFMDYLVRDDVQRGLFLGPHSVLVNVPDAGRFALHKLAVAERRGHGSTSIKAKKDRRQAAALIEVLADSQPGTLAAAARAARDHHDRGLIKDIKRSLKLLPEQPRSTVTALVAR